MRSYLLELGTRRSHHPSSVLKRKNKSFDRHRQLGVHVSFVRSLEMDKFTPDQLLALELGGNARAGMEIHKPADYSSRQAVKYSESLKAKVGHALKEGPKQAEAKAPTTSSGAFVYSATGATSAKPAWAK